MRGAELSAGVSTGNGRMPGRWPTPVPPRAGTGGAAQTELEAED
jgi:hypothetical protein